MWWQTRKSRTETWELEKKRGEKKEQRVINDEKSVCEYVCVCMCVSMCLRLTIGVRITFIISEDRIFFVHTITHLSIKQKAIYYYTLKDTSKYKWLHVQFTLCFHRLFFTHRCMIQLFQSLLKIVRNLGMRGLVIWPLLVWEFRNCYLDGMSSQCLACALVLSMMISLTCTRRSHIKLKGYCWTLTSLPQTLIHTLNTLPVLTLRLWHQ